MIAMGAPAITIKNSSSAHAAAGDLFQEFVIADVAEERWRGFLHPILCSRSGVQAELEQALGTLPRRRAVRQRRAAGAAFAGCDHDQVRDWTVRCYSEAELGKAYRKKREK